MKANELRLGNYVQQLGEIFTVSTTTIQEIISDDCYEPIPLTEEWLVKFGFENHKKFFSGGAHTVLFAFSPDMSVALYDNQNETGLGYLCPNLDETKYVHQLQNLYFALTGEELTITT